MWHASALLIGIFVGASGAAAQTPELALAIEDVARRWPGIEHIEPARLDNLMADGKAIVFDVREEEEFRVSRIPGSVRVNPMIDTATFLDRHGTSVNGKTAAFYCSVGVRSSRVAARVADALKARGAVNVVDLAGGIFAWHNGARPLVDDQGSTTRVHPFDASWGRLLTRQEFISTTPAQPR